MICSLNEVGALLHKAAVGAGYPTGLARSIEQAGVWLCAQELDGVGAALAALPAGAQRGSTVQHDGAVIIVDDAMVGHCGPSIFEMLSATSAERVVVRTPDAPLLLAGFAGFAAATSGGGFQLTTDSGRIAQIGSASTLGIDELAMATSIEIIAVPAQVEASPAPRPHGVEVDDTAWAAAQKLAKRTYVPATDASRLSGAGAGLTDND